MDNAAAEVMAETVCGTNREGESLQSVSPQVMNEFSGYSRLYNAYWEFVLTSTCVDSPRAIKFN